jgi:hypothetical protein
MGSFHADGSGHFREDDVRMKERNTTSQTRRDVFLLPLACAAPLVLFSPAAPADVFKYIDERGGVHYSDRKLSDGYRLVMRDGKFVKPQKRQPKIRSYPLRRAYYFSKNRGQLASMIKKVAAENRLHPALLHAVVHAESSYNPGAVSKKGAVGLMQLMPATARRYGVYDRRDARENLSGGARYLRDLIDLFGHDLRLALAAYNAGENAVRKYGNQIPPYPETRQYVRKVITLFRGSLAQK